MRALGTLEQNGFSHRKNVAINFCRQLCAKLVTGVKQKDSQQESLFAGGCEFQAGMIDDNLYAGGDYKTLQLTAI